MPPTITCNVTAAALIAYEHHQLQDYLLLPQTGSSRWQPSLSGSLPFKDHACCFLLWVPLMLATLMVDTLMMCTWSYGLSLSEGLWNSLCAHMQGTPAWFDLCTACCPLLVAYVGLGLCFRHDHLLDCWGRQHIYIVSLRYVLTTIVLQSRVPVIYKQQCILVAHCVAYQCGVCCQGVAEM